MKVMGSMRALAVVMLVALSAVACGGTPNSSSSSSPGPVSNKAPQNLVIAYQPGIGYAPLLIMKQQHWIEHDYPTMNVQYKLLSNGDAIRDGIIAGQIQVGSGGTGPFLVGWAKGVDYRLIATMNMMNLWLNSTAPQVHSLKDIKPSMKVALPAVDAIQAIALRKLAQKQLGDAHKLDSNLVAMAHPDGLQNLLAGSIAAHFTSPPYQDQEVQQGAHTIAKSYDAFGPGTFNSVYTTQRFYDEYPGFTGKLYGYVQRAIDLINKDPAQAATIVSAADGKPDMAAQYRTWMTQSSEVTYTSKPQGFLTQASFMKQIGLISRTPGSVKDIELPVLAREGGS
jgi:NitT/TauT family transport system substrate-binding protein